MSDETWETLKEIREKSKVSWNLFITELLKIRTSKHD